MKLGVHIIWKGIGSLWALLQKKRERKDGRGENKRQNGGKDLDSNIAMIPKSDRTGEHLRCPLPIWSHGTKWRGSPRAAENAASTSQHLEGKTHGDGGKTQRRVCGKHHLNVRHRTKRENISILKNALPVFMQLLSLKKIYIPLINYAFFSFIPPSPTIR